MKLLLTGATGFIGTNFVLRLHRKYNITALVRATSDTKNIEKYCQIYRYDGDIKKLIEFCKKEQFDGVVHLAATFFSQHSYTNLSMLLEGNITLGLHILEAIHNTNHKPKFFINTTTFSQFMNSINYHPKTLYDAMKQSFYDLIIYYQNIIEDTVFTHLMLYNPYGPHETTKKIFRLWQESLLKKTAIHMSSGYQKIDITHVDDVVDAYDVLISHCISKQIEKNIIYTTENKRYSIRELAHIFEEIAGDCLKILWGQDPKNTIRTPISSMDSKHIQKLPNWRPKITLKRGLKKIYNQKIKVNP